MNYKEALEYIHGTRKFGCKLGLENIKTLLGMLENPHEKLKYVHVAGTNGKGSTVAFISNIMTLLPGDVIMTGTPEGIGPLSAGDEIEIRIQGVGSLVNRVVNREND